MTGSFEFVEHTADFQIAAAADSFEELCAITAHGMMCWCFGDCEEELSAEWEEQWSSRGSDCEDILVEWLSSLLCYCATHYCRALNFSNLSHADGVLRGVVGFAKAQAQDDIKAVTYHNLKVENKDGRWQTTVTFDI